MKRIFTLLLAVCCFSVVNAQFVENFDYTAGQPLTSNNWIQVGTTATNPITVTNPGLSYTGYANSNIGNAATLITTGQDVYRDLSTIYTSGSVYVSFMLYVDSVKTGDYFICVGPSTSTTLFSARLYLKSSGSNFVIGIGKSNELANYGTTLYNLNTTYVVVLKYTFNTTSTIDDRSSVFMFSSTTNPTIPTTEPSTPDLVDTASAKNDLADVGRIFLRQGSTSAAAGVKVDGIRVADGWYNAPLPVSLRSFNASLVEGRSSLNWSIANENNVNGYDVEKSNDGKTFTNIGFVKANNNATYTFVDNNVAGLTYYRLKISDRDGKFLYSKVLTVTTKKGIKLEIFPNPVVNNLTVSHEKASASAVVKVVTFDGKTVLTRNIQAGATQSTVDVSKLIKGNYMVLFTDNGSTSSTQFVKQ